MARKNAQGQERPANIECPYTLKMCCWPLCLGEYEPDPACLAKNTPETEPRVDA